jgi:general secretion pathway protein A
MYERFYGLTERPFDLSPDPRFLFLSNKHREALTHLRYGLGGRPGLTVLIGEAGTGKTTLVRTALQTVDAAAARIVQLSNPTLTRTEFFEYLASGFGFTAQAGVSKTRFLTELEEALDGHSQTVLALIVDEAQSLPFELLEEIRLLTNIDGGDGRSLTVALVGQPELAARLNDVSLRQLKQRITLRCELEPLNLAETAAYITARVRVAGGRAEQLFSREAVMTIQEFSQGIPRTISVICDNSLVNGFATGVKPIGRDIVLEICRDFHIRSPRASAPKSVGAQPPAEADTPAQPSTSDGNADAPEMFQRMSRPRRFSFF